MKPALFAFTDSNTTQCVYVHECDEDMAHEMITRCITHEWMSPLKDFDASEVVALFVAANKRGPYDMIVVPVMGDEDDYSDLDALYQITRTKDCSAIAVVPLIDRPDFEEEIWIIKQVTVH